MDYLSILALLFNNKISLFVLQAFVIITLYNIFSKRIGMIWSGILSYMITGYLLLALPLSMMLPNITLMAQTFLTLVWPLWIYFEIDIPYFLLPYMFG